MSALIYCDNCDTLVDPDEDMGTSDSDIGVYFCDRCCTKWEATVMGVKPIEKTVLSFSAETLAFAQMCERELEENTK
jgi:hypothetical protein